MATWSITPTAATITSSGVATFPQNNGNSDVEYTITYTDNDGCSGTAKYTIPKRSCQLVIQGPPNRTYTSTGTACSTTIEVMVLSTVNDSPSTPTVSQTAGTTGYVAVTSVAPLAAGSSTYKVTLTATKFPTNGSLPFLFKAVNSEGCEESFTVVLYAGSCTGPQVPATMTIGGCDDAYFSVSEGSCGSSVPIVTATSVAPFVNNVHYDSNEKTVLVNFSPNVLVNNSRITSRQAEIITTDCLGNTASTRITQTSEWKWYSEFVVSLTSPNMNPSTPNASHVNGYIYPTCSTNTPENRQELANSLSQGFTIIWNYKYLTSYDSALSYTSYTETYSLSDLRSLILNYSGSGGIPISLSQNSTHNLPGFPSGGSICWCVYVVITGPIQLLRTAYNSGDKTGTCQWNSC